jgi:hypothetical protein
MLLMIVIQHYFIRTKAYESVYGNTRLQGTWKGRGYLSGYVALHKLHGNLVVILFTPETNLERGTIAVANELQNPTTTSSSNQYGVSVIGRLGSCFLRPTQRNTFAREYDANAV